MQLQKCGIYELRCRWHYTVVPFSFKIIIYTTQLIITYLSLHLMIIDMAKLSIFNILPACLQYKNWWICLMFQVTSNCYYFINSINQRKALRHWQIIFLRNDRERWKRNWQIKLLLLLLFFWIKIFISWLHNGHVLLCEYRNWSSKVVNALRVKTWKINYSHLERNKRCFLKYSNKC